MKIDIKHRSGVALNDIPNGDLFVVPVSEELYFKTSGLNWNDEIVCYSVRDGGVKYFSPRMMVTGVRNVTIDLAD